MHSDHITLMRVLGGTGGCSLVLGILTREPAVFCLLFLSSLSLFCLRWLFRDPERNVPQGDGLILSAADGRVCFLDQVRETHFLEGDGIAIGVYLSLFNVHVNRIPVSGIVRLVSHRPGHFLPAFQKKVSEKNEQQIIGIESARGRILLKQIAGSLARRIVCRLNPGDIVRAGDRFGMITFGSRVDVVLPLCTDIKVNVGDRVRAGETVIGVFS